MVTTADAQLARSRGDLIQPFAPRGYDDTVTWSARFNVVVLDELEYLVADHGEDCSVAVIDERDVSPPPAHDRWAGPESDGIHSEFVCRERSSSVVWIEHLAAVRRAATTTAWVVIQRHDGVWLIATSSKAGPALVHRGTRPR